MRLMRRAVSDDHKDQRRAALLQAALDEFFEKGFSAARMGDIARRAGLSKGAVYLYFDSKEALFRDLIESRISPNVAAMAAIADGAVSIRQALDAMAAFGQQLIQTSDMPRVLKVLVGDAHTFPQLVADYRVNVIERILGIIAGVLGAAAERGEIQLSGPPMLAARLVVAPFAMSGVWQAVFSADPKAAVDLETLFAMHATHMRRAFGLKEDAP